MTLTKGNYNTARCDKCLFSKFFIGKLYCHESKPPGDYNWSAVKPNDFCSKYEVRGNVGERSDGETR